MASLMGPPSEASPFVVAFQSLEHFPSDCVRGNGLESVASSPVVASLPFLVAFLLPWVACPLVVCALVVVSHLLWVAVANPLVVSLLPWVAYPLVVCAPVVVSHLP